MLMPSVDELNLVLNLCKYKWFSPSILSNSPAILKGRMANPLKIKESQFFFDAAMALHLNTLIFL